MSPLKMHNNSKHKNNLLTEKSNLILNLNTDIFRKQFKSIWLWILRKDALIFVLFVGLASIFWWGRTMSSPRDMDVRVNISYTDISEQIIFTKELPKNLTIVVRDNGQQLRRINQQNLNLAINLSPYLSMDHGVFTLTADILRPRLQDILPGSTIIQQIIPETIEVAYYRQQSKMVPVVLQSQVSVAPQHQLVGDAKITPDHVQILGDKDNIDTISHIATDTIRITDLRESIRMSAPLLPPSGTRVQPASVQIEWQAEQFTEKSFVIPIEIIGLPNDKQIRLFPQQVEVKMRVGISHFAEVQESDLQAICHYPTQPCNALPIEIKTDNPHISNIRFSPTSVEYIIQF